MELFHTLIGREMTLKERELTLQAFPDFDLEARRIEMTLKEGESTFPDFDVTISMTGMRIQARKGICFYKSQL